MVLRKIDYIQEIDSGSEVNWYDYDHIWRYDGIYVLEAHYKRMYPTEEVSLRYNLYKVEGESLNLIKTTTREYDPKLITGEDNKGDSVVLLFQRDRIYLLRFKKEARAIIPVLGEFDGPDMELPEMKTPIIDFSIPPDHSSILIMGESNWQETEILSINETGIKRITIPIDAWRLCRSPNNKYVTCKGDGGYTIIDCQTLEYRHQVVNRRIDDIGFTLDSQYLFYIDTDNYLNLCTKELNLIERIKVTGEFSRVTMDNGDDTEVIYNHHQKELIVRSLELNDPPPGEEKFTIYYFNLVDQTCKKRIIEEIETKEGVYHSRIIYNGNDFLTLYNNIETEVENIKLYIYQETGKLTKVARNKK